MKFLFLCNFQLLALIVFLPTNAEAENVSDVALNLSEGAADSYHVPYYCRYLPYLSDCYWYRYYPRYRNYYRYYDDFYPRWRDYGRGYYGKWGHHWRRNFRDSDRWRGSDRYYGRRGYEGGRFRDRSSFGRRSFIGTSSGNGETLVREEAVDDVNIKFSAKLEKVFFSLCTINCPQRIFANKCPNNDN